tara:strand:+ start:66 stop:1121 length:1056 start_codon:yes stop_codon:yes gene_type:complete
MCGVFLARVTPPVCSLSQLSGLSAMSDGDEHAPLERAPDGSGVCTVDNLPVGVTLGSIEALMLPLCSAPIIAIGRTALTTALIEFSFADDAEACCGNHKLLGNTINVQRRRLAPAAVKNGAAANGAFCPTVPADKDEANSLTRQRSQTSKISAEEKERRLNRVGLSYRCGKCGQPKKGHICPGDAEGFNAEALSSDATRDDGGRPSGGRRRRRSKSGAADDVWRPPAVITPDEAEEATDELDQLHKIPIGPSSTNSGIAFSPGILMHELLTPGIIASLPTPGVGVVPALSPNSIDELGNLLQSQSPALGTLPPGLASVTRKGLARGFGFAAFQQGTRKSARKASPAIPRCP